VKAGVKHDGNPPSLLVPPRRVGTHVPKVTFGLVADPIAVRVHEFHNFWFAAKRDGHIRHAEFFD